LQNIDRALRPGGVFLMVDIKASSRLEDNVGVPLAAFLYTISTMHCMTVPLALDGAGVGTVWGPATGHVDARGRRIRACAGEGARVRSVQLLLLLLLLLPRTTNTSYY